MAWQAIVFSFKGNLSLRSVARVARERQQNRPVSSKGNLSLRSVARVARERQQNRPVSSDDTRRPVTERCKNLDRDVSVVKCAVALFLDGACWANAGRALYPPSRPPKGKRIFRGMAGSAQRVIPSRTEDSPKSVKTGGVGDTRRCVTRPRYPLARFRPRIACLRFPGQA
jgi:hypothetical protein